MCAKKNQILIDNVTTWLVYAVGLTNYMVDLTTPKTYTGFFKD